ncbi:hypothetical protein D3C85_1508710 [compost metagenome]
MHRGLPHPFGQAGAKVAGILATAPFEPDILPGIKRAVGDLPIGFGNAQAGGGTNRVGTEGNTCTDLAKGRCSFEQLHAEMGMTAQIQRQCHTSDTTADNTDVQSRLRSMHSKVPMRLIVIGVGQSSPVQCY